MPRIKKNVFLHISHIMRDVKKNFPLYSMLIPGFLLVIVFSYLPMLGVGIAFKKIDFMLGILGSPNVGFDNFKFLFESSDAWLITRNTLFYNIIFITLGLFVSVAFAVMLNEIKQKFLSKTYQTILMLPYFLSWVVVSYIGMAFFNTETGLINSAIIPFFTGQKASVAWYTDPKLWPLFLIAANLWKTAGYSSVVYLAAISGIDAELYEAAKIDGANRFAQIRHITLPCLSPLMIILTILAIGKIFNADFGLFYQFTLNQGPLKEVTNVIDTYVFNMLMLTGATSLGLSAAAGLYQSVVGFVLVTATNTIVRKIDPGKALF
jgi:putative aldouronate transport system permease protein